jgi:histidine ammonia-lyase
MKGILSPEAISRINRSSARVENIISGDKAVYGINTGFGPLCTTIIEQSKLSQLQHNILLSHSVGVGPNLDDEVVKLMLVLKIHSLSKGHSGIRLEVIKWMMWMLEAGMVSVVPSQGSVGASGDLAPLAHLFLPLIGEGKVKWKGEVVDSGFVLKKLEKLPLDLAPKEGLALINGTQFILAHAVQLVERFYNILAYADFSAAMMIEGLKGSASPFRRELHELRPYPGNVHVAHRLWTLIKGSEINESHIGCNRVQDPYSLRCVPQVHGTSRDVWLHLKERVEIELNAVTDNPIMLEYGNAVSGGNFHGQPLALPLDYAALALSEIGNISDRRIYLAMMGQSEGVPKLLLSETGVNSGFMIVQYTSAALASENKALCFPASADSIPTSMGQEDHVSMGSISGRKAMQVASNVEKILAIEFMCACQALDFAAPYKPHPYLQGIHDIVREKIPFAEKDRNFGDDINNMIQLIDQLILLNFIKSNHDRYEDIRSPYHNLFEVY